MLEYGRFPYLPRDSISSLLLCSIPKWVLIEAYRAVPVKFLPWIHRGREHARDRERD